VRREDKNREPKDIRGGKKMRMKGYKRNAWREARRGDFVVDSGVDITESTKTPHMYQIWSGKSINLKSITTSLGGGCARGGGDIYNMAEVVTPPGKFGNFPPPRISAFARLASGVC
jgi:hypothetical protein